MRRVVIGGLAAGAAALIIAACGGSGTSPSPTPGGGNNGQQQPPPNTPPQIKSIAVSDSRIEVGTPVTVTAVVEDAETPVASLTYAWTSDTGTFSGSGATVTWTAGQNAKTPGDFTLTLTVTERYGSGAAAAENKVASDLKVHVNNSPKELADLSLRFLGDFANSSVSPDRCVAEFSDTCAQGKKDEFNDISDNRHDFLIMSSNLKATGVEMAPTRLTATVHTFCAFTSKIITTEPRDESCQKPGSCPLNSVGSVEGDCWTTDVYEKGRWWLCQSHFTSKSPLTAFARAFFGSRHFEIP
jgi:hypothetical protein